MGDLHCSATGVDCERLCATLDGRVHGNGKLAIRATLIVNGTDCVFGLLGVGASVHARRHEAARSHTCHDNCSSGFFGERLDALNRRLAVTPAPFAKGR